MNKNKSSIDLQIANRVLEIDGLSAKSTRLAIPVRELYKLLGKGTSSEIGGAVFEVEIQVHSACEPR